AARAARRAGRDFRRDAAHSSRHRGADPAATSARTRGEAGRDAGQALEWAPPAGCGRWLASARVRIARRPLRRARVSYGGSDRADALVLEPSVRDVPRPLLSRRGHGGGPPASPTWWSTGLVGRRIGGRATTRWKIGRRLA